MNKQVLQLPLELIEVGERLRPVDPDYVALIADSMRDRGQDTPIRVTLADKDGRHRLIAGAHRLAAARELGWPKIDAIAFEGSELQAELLEIDENLIRRELSELDRAVFLARRKEVYEALYPHTRHGGDRRSDQVNENANLIGIGASFAEVTAQKLGLHPNSVRRLVARTRIAEDVRTQIATTWIADKGTELDALAKLPPADQRKVVKLLLRERDPAPSVGAALKRLRGETDAPVDVDEAQYQKLLSAWKKAGAKARRLFVDHLAENGAIETVRAA